MLRKCVCNFLVRALCTTVELRSLRGHHRTQEKGPINKSVPLIKTIMLYYERFTGRDPYPSMEVSQSRDFTVVKICFGVFAVKSWLVLTAVL